MELSKGYGPLWGNWYVCELIGQGAYGKVYKIQRSEFGHVWYAALKVITIPQSKTEYDSIVTENGGIRNAKSYFREIVDEVVNEFVNMSKFQGSSYIVNYEDHMVIPHQDGCGWDIFIRMELLESLGHYMLGNKLSQRDVIQLGIDVCKGLELCHRANLVHRDIKPENIFKSELGTFKIGDFGVSRTLDKTNGFITKRGTPSYMAPELYHGQKAGKNVDIYSMGIVLYWLMNDNRLPFMPPYPEKITYKDSKEAIERRMKGEAIPKPVSADQGLAQIILKACEYRPQFRYNSAEELREDLEKQLRQEEQPGVGGDSTRSFGATSAIYAGKPVKHKNSSKGGVPILICSAGILLSVALIGTLGAMGRQKMTESQSADSGSQLADAENQLFSVGKMVEEIRSSLDQIHGRYENFVENRLLPAGIDNTNIAKQQDTDENTETLTAATAETYRSEAELGNADAWCDLGIMYEYGEGIEQDYQMAKECYAKAAELDSGRGWLYLGTMYEFGLGTEMDLSYAANCYQTAGELGEENGWNYLGTLYYTADQWEDHYQKAAEAYQKGVAAGNSESMKKLGFLYEMGRGVNQDYEAAKDYYEMAGNAGNSDGWVYLGTLYVDLGGEENQKEAFQCFQKAAEMGSAQGWLYMGIFYETGIAVEQQYAEAFRCYENAAELDNADAWAYLGLLYELGNGTEQSYEEAIRCYEKGTDLGSAEAWIYLGMLYEYGDGVQKDYNYAIQCYENAWELGDTDGAVFAGRCYMSEGTTEEELEKGEELLRQAGEQGNGEGWIALGVLYEGRGTLEFYEEAKQCYENAIDCGEPEGWYYLGWLYEDGLGVEPDKEVARQYYEKAISEGYAEAQEGLDRLQ